MQSLWEHFRQLSFAIFIFLYILAISEFLFRDKIYQKAKKILFISICFLLVFFIGLRPAESDRDWLMYEEYFTTFCTYSYKDILFNNTHRVKEIGYIFLNKIFCESSFRTLMVFVAILSIIPKFYFLYKYSTLTFFSLLIYYSSFLFLRDFTQIRDAIAVSFSVFALLAIFYKKNYFFLIFALLAFLFHRIAVVLFPVGVFLIITKFKYYIWLLFLSPLLYFIKVNYFLKHLPLLPEQLSKYNSLEGGGSLSIILFGLLTVICVLFRIEKINHFDKFLLKLTILGVFFGFLFLHHPVLSRVSYIFLFFCLPLISNVLRGGNMKWRLFLFALFSIGSLYLFINSLSLTLL